MQPAQHNVSKPLLIKFGSSGNGRRRMKQSEPRLAKVVKHKSLNGLALVYSIIALESETEGLSFWR